MSVRCSIFALAALLSLLSPLVPNAAAQTPPASDAGRGDGSSAGGSGSDDALTKQWRATLKYGINSEIIDLISSLKSRKDPSLNSDLVTTFSTTFDDKVRSAILDLFDTLSYGGAEEAVRSYLQSNPGNAEVENRAISYLSRTVEHPGKETVTVLESFVDGPDQSLSDAAVRGLGAIADREGPTAFDFAELEKKLLAHIESGDLPTASLGDAILTLGDLKAQKAVDPLLAIVNDTTQPAVLREYAADSLGRIGDKRAIPALVQLVRSENAFVRAYAASALGRFGGSESADALSAALRDSAPGVRVAALKGIAQAHLTDQSPAVVYKTEHDPDMNVRLEAVKTLGALGTGEGWKTLQSILTESNSLTLRTAALNELVGGDLAGSIDTFRKVIQSEWAARDKHVLYAVGEALSRTNSPLLSSLYELLLSHPDYIVKMYALRGIALNGVSSLKASVEKVGSENGPAVLKREVDRTLSTLGGAGAPPSGSSNTGR
ncbi:HEAT repeat domain-containing protein [Salinispira pacifica]